MERRVGDRRVYTRGTPERRRAIAGATGCAACIFTSLALALPHQLRHPTSRSSRRPARASRRRIDSMSVVAPAHAYEGIIREAAALYRVDASLIRSIMQAESAFDPSAVSRAGAMGLMQLMPDMAEAFGVEHPFDPRENIMAGARLLRELLDQHHGNVKLAVASYNAGPDGGRHLRRRAAVPRDAGLREEGHGAHRRCATRRQQRLRWIRAGFTPARARPAAGARHPACRVGVTCREQL